jgi:hypothetical protein
VLGHATLALRELKSRAEKETSVPTAQFNEHFDKSREQARLLAQQMQVLDIKLESTARQQDESVSRQLVRYASWDSYSREKMMRVHHADLTLCVLGLHVRARVLRVCECECREGASLS